MRRYVLRRLLLFVPTLFGASLLVFILLRLVPGDIAEILVYQTGSESSAVQKKQIEQIRAELGLDRPVLVQYGHWMWDALRGDFGQSYSQRRPVSAILAERFPRSMELAASIAVGWVEGWFFKDKKLRGFKPGVTVYDNNTFMKTWIAP